jgi:predicted Zn-dependent peptidase
VVYIGENHEIPWFEASLMVRTGPFLEPAAKIGVEGVTPTVIRSGGTATMTGEQMNERMEFLAGSISATGLSIHMRHVDEGLRIWMDLLQNPAFPDDKLRREKEQMLVGIRNRNKNVAAVGARTYNQLIYGADSPITAEPTEETVGSLAREDLVAWHRKYWGANNAILVVTGDFKRAEMLKKLEAAFGTWRNAEKAVPAIPKTIRQSARAGVYMVQPEVIPNQGVIRIGHLGLMQDDPDYAAMDVMNYILGGGSFSSRITKIVRSDHGLAYSTGSGLPGGVLYPGTFTASCQTKNSTVVFAAQLMLNEIERIRTERRAGARALPDQRRRETRSSSSASTSTGFYHRAARTADAPPSRAQIDAGTRSSLGYPVESLTDVPPGTYTSPGAAAQVRDVPPGRRPHGEAADGPRRGAAVEPGAGQPVQHAAEGDDRSGGRRHAGSRSTRSSRPSRIRPRRSTSSTCGSRASG